jgi:hypothetical protein
VRFVSQLMGEMLHAYYGEEASDAPPEEA